MTDQHGHVINVPFNFNTSDYYMLVQDNDDHQATGVRMGILWDRETQTTVIIDGKTQNWGGYVGNLYLKGDTTTFVAELTSPFYSGSLQYRFHIIKQPDFLFKPNGNESWSMQASAQVGVTHTDQQQLSYVWTQSDADPGSTASWQPYTISSDLSKQDGEGEWFLHLRAVHSSGTTVHQSSKRYLLDQSAPTITVAMKDTDGQAYAEGSWSNKPITITAEAIDSFSGISSFEYSLDGANHWKPYTTNDAITIDTNGIHTVYFKARDQLGRESDLSRTIQINAENLLLNTSLEQADGTPYADGS